MYLLASFPLEYMGVVAPQPPPYIPAEAHIKLFFQWSHTYTILYMRDSGSGMGHECNAVAGLQVRKSGV